MNGAGETATGMADSAARLTLLSWLSPAFPTGGFAYSAGLETVAHVAVQSLDDVQAWLGGQIASGPLWNDAVLLAAGWRAADDTELAMIADLARALVSASERLEEMNGQGTSFADASLHWLAEPLPRDLPYPVALGAAAKRAGLPVQATLEAFLHGFAVNQVQCAIRLSLLGQNGAAQVLAALSTAIAETAAKAAQSGLDDLGSAGILADIASMNHEALAARLFRS
jgi:urease accessory protein